jgi:hypothetical protein
MPVAPPVSQEPHTAPHDEIIGLVRELLASAPGGVSLDALANALRERGFSRPAGSPRLITRLRRIKELDLGRSGTIRLVGNGAEPVVPGGAALALEAVVEAPAESSADVDAESAAAPAAATGEPTPPEGAPRRRRRRGGRRRRGRRNNGPATAEATPESA